MTIEVFTLARQLILAVSRAVPVSKKGCVELLRDLAN